MIGEAALNGTVTNSSTPSKNATLLLALLTAHIRGDILTWMFE